MNTNTVTKTAAVRTLDRIKSAAPVTYRAVMSRLNTSGMGAANSSGFFSDLGDAFIDIVKTAPSVYQSKQQAEAELTRAQQIAESELSAAKIELQRQQAEAQLAAQQAAIAKNQAALVEQQQRYMTLRQEETQLDSVIANLSGGQKTGLAVAGVLALVLLGLQFAK